VKTREIRRGLTAKGFQEHENADHRYFYLYYENKKTGIYTKFSHSTSDVGDNLLGQMAKQIRLKRSEFDDLINCPMSAQRYFALLVEKREITPAVPQQPNPRT